MAENPTPPSVFETVAAVPPTHGPPGLDTPYPNASPSPTPDPGPSPSPGPTPVGKGTSMLAVVAILVTVAAVASWLVFGDDRGAAVSAESPTADGAAPADDDPGDAADGPRDAEIDDAAEVDGETDADPALVEANVPPVATTEGAVVRVVVTGEFAAPSGTVEGEASGTGFVIGSDGLAVTNNHVVGGAAAIEVHVAGEATPRPARLIAASECSDLAVIDISGAPLPVLTLTETTSPVGGTVYAAGYPLGDPQFTVTRGIVSRSAGSGDSPFSSVASVIEHDASIAPGNSGGPLFNERWEVIGINYEANSASGLSRAIAAVDARPIIDDLSQGVSPDSIGVSGEIIDLTDRYGLFVNAVAPGSPAARAGIRAGDVVLELENVTVSDDGTMNTYCGTLRTHGNDAQLSLAVLRPSTGEVLVGQLNGDAPLATAFDAAAAMEAIGAEADLPPAGAMSMQPTLVVTDDTGLLSAEVPTHWIDIDASPRTIDGVDGVAVLLASPSINSYAETYETAGMQMVGYPSLGFDFDQLWTSLDSLRRDCADVGPVEDLTIDGYDGVGQVLTGCGGLDTSLVFIQVTAPGYHVQSIIQIVDEADVEAAEVIVATMDITP